MSKAVNFPFFSSLVFNKRRKKKQSARIYRLKASWSATNDKKQSAHKETVHTCYPYRTDCEVFLSLEKYEWLRGTGRRCKIARNSSVRDVNHTHSHSPNKGEISPNSVTRGVSREKGRNFKVKVTLFSIPCRM